MQKLQLSKIRKDFPTIKDKYIYFDNAATSLVPNSVIEKLTDYYKNYKSNIKRSSHRNAEKSSIEYENTRNHLKTFLNADFRDEIVFTKGSTESINIISHSYENTLKKGDEILLSIFEHHSNLVPWQILAKKTGAKLKFINIDNNYKLDIKDLEKKINKKTKIVAITAISNITGTINPIKEISKIIRKNSNAIFVVDAAQAISHIEINVKDIDCDFLCFSAHKSLGPTGLGILYGKKNKINKLSPLLYGGEMISEVSTKHSLFKESPQKFEAGTPNIAAVIAFNESLNYIEKIGIETIKNHDQKLIKHTKNLLSKFPEIKVFSPENINNCSSIISFTIENIHPHDIAEVFNYHNIAIRAGQHCAHPLSKELNTIATARLSFHLYNTTEEIDKIKAAIEHCLKLFK